MRMICRERATGKLIESQQSGGVIPPGTLTRNAVAAGYAAADIEEVEVTAAEWAAIKQEWIDGPAAAQRAALPDPDAELATAIQGVDTSLILDAGVKKAIDDLKNVLAAGNGKARAKGRSV